MPRVGQRDDPATRNIVVLPEPFGPSRTHRSGRRTVQEMSSRSGNPSRTTETWSSRTATSAAGSGRLTGSRPIERAGWHLVGHDTLDRNVAGMNGDC